MPLLKEMIRVMKSDGAFLLRDLVRKTGLTAKFHVNFFGMKYNQLMKKEYYDSLLAGFSKQEFRNFKREMGLKGLKHTTQFITHQGLEKPSELRRKEYISIPASFGQNMLKKMYVTKYKII